MPKFVHLNGRVVPAASARIGIFDRGLLYGDGLFETLRAYRGVPFALDEHLARLESSAGFLGFAVPRRPWRRDIDTLLRRNRLHATDAAIRITVTRGAAPPGLMPPARVRPTVLMYAGRIDATIATAQRHGVRVAVLPFARHGFLAEHKMLDYMPGVLGKVIAARHGAFEGLFMDTDGRITEGATSNVFVWRRRQLCTPAAVGILPGLTRKMIIDAATADGVQVVERPLSARDLFAADEAFLTSSLMEVVPITAVDERRIGGGGVGSRTQHMQRRYRQTVDQALAAVQFR